MTVPGVRGTGAPSLGGAAPEVQLSADEREQAERARRVQDAADLAVNRDSGASAGDINATQFDVEEDDNPELNEEEKKQKELAEQKAKMQTQQWWNLAAAAGVVGLAVIGIFASSYLAAAIIVGAGALEITVTVIVAGGAFAGAGLTLYFALIRPGWKEKIKVLNED